MIVISPKLLADFQAVFVEAYIQRKLDAYAESAPAAYDEIGEDNYRRYIESALAKGEACHLNSEEGADGILSLMDHLGHGFDQDPLFAWAALAADVPTDGAGPTAAAAADQAAQKLERARDRLHEFRRSAEGANGQHLTAALNRFIALELRDLTDAAGEAGLLRRLESLYPERFNQLDAAGLRNGLIPLAKDKARTMGLSSNAGLFLVACGMFMLGSFFDEDPRYQHKFSPNLIAFNQESILLNALKKHFRETLGNKKRLAATD